MEERINKTRRSGSGWPGLFVGSGLFLLAAWFLIGPDLTDLPEMRGVAINRALISTAPLRVPLGDPPAIQVGVFQYTCMDCHKLFPARTHPPEKLYQHRHVVMNHGINDQCRNCHDVENRDRLVFQNGETIPFAGVVLLCSNCHGPIYRDWERGMHGRTNGYWDEALGPQHRLGCTECHDPHSPRTPAMEPMPPLPPPHTLRMAKPEAHEEAEESDPLRQALIRAEEERKYNLEEEEH